MSNVKPEHIQKAQLFVDEYKDTSSDFVQPHRALVEQVAQLYADLDLARADARVLADEVRRWREGMESETFNRFGYVEYEVTDASGALERNRSKP